MNKALVYLTVVSSYIPAVLFSLNLGFMQISFYRIFVLILPFACFAKMILNYTLSGNLFDDGARLNLFSIHFMLFWLFYSLLSFLWSPNVGDTLRHSYFIVCGVICIFSFSLILENVDDMSNCLLASTIMVFIHGIIGWNEIFSGNYVVETEYTVGYALQKLPVSAMHNVNGFATCMSIGIFIAFAVWKTSNNKIISLFGFITMFSSFLIVIWSRSRANIYGIALGILVLILLSGKKIFRNIFLTLMMLFAFILVSNMFFPWVTDLFVETVLPGISGVNLEYGSDHVRMNLIKNGLHFLAQNLFMGTGAGGIEHWMASEWIYDTGGITNIHNWWMEILTGYGIFVFIGYIIFYVKLCIDMFRIFRSSSNYKEVYIAFAMIGALVSFVIGSISSSSNIASYQIWVFFAIVIAFQGISARYSQHNKS